jgi:superfamily II DNA or RNA helicase
LGHAPVRPHRAQVIVFFVTARLTQLAAELFTAMGVDVLEMHSRKSQPHRSRVAEAFRSGVGVVMFTSDVSARGVDYPDVSLVVQVMPPFGVKAGFPIFLGLGLRISMSDVCRRTASTAVTRAWPCWRGFSLTV